jgi:hypothetical protein
MSVSALEPLVAGSEANPLSIELGAGSSAGDYTLNWLGKPALASAPCIGLNTAHGWCDILSRGCLKLAATTNSTAGSEALGNFHRSALHWTGPPPLTFQTAFRTYSDRSIVVFEAGFPAGVPESAIKLETLDNGTEVRISPQTAFPAWKSYGNVVTLTNGSVVTLRQRERPKLLLTVDGEPGYLVNGAGWHGDCDRTFTLVQPIAQKTDEVQPRKSARKDDDVTAPQPEAKIAATVGSSGSIDITLGALKLAVSSTFTEAGPLLHSLGTAVDPQQPLRPWSVPIAVSKASDGASWTVTAVAAGYKIDRTVTVESHVVRIKDIITTSGNTSSPPVGIEITHRTSFVGAAGSMKGAVLPGATGNWACHSMGQEEATAVGDRTRTTTTGNPTIHAHSSHGGAGMIPLDDVFELHSYGNVSAYHTAKLPVQSDPPAARAESDVCGFLQAPCVCQVTDPPSIALADSSLVLPAAESYTQEWAVYPLPASCPDYYCFINSVRSDFKVDEITMPGTGFLAMYPKDTSTEVVPPAGFKAGGGDWGLWTESELEQFYEREAVHFVIVDSEMSSHNGTCIPGLLNCEGGCFLDSSDATITRWKGIINATRRLGHGRRVHVYQNSGIDSSVGANIRHADCAITDAKGTTTAYRSCAAGQDYPLFFANSTNSYGKTLEAVYHKVLEIGFHGVYHDEFLSDGDDYTFSVWDRRSGQLDAKTKSVTSMMGSIVLMTQEHEIKLMGILKQDNGSLIANGQPSTRTLREYCRAGPTGSTVAGGAAGASLHFREDSPQAAATHTHLFTPMTLNRFSGQRVDLDPKYNASCAGADGGEREYMSAACVGRNIGDSLDFGVTTLLYDGLFRNESASGTSILHAMFPLTARRLGEGLIVGRERVITKNNGTARWDAGAAEWDFTVAGSSYANRNPLRPPLVREGVSTSGTATAVVQTYGRTGLLNVSRTVELSAAQTVAVELVPGEVVIVSLKVDPVTLPLVVVG